MCAMAGLVTIEKMSAQLMSQWLHRLNCRLVAPAWGGKSL
jgi:hypothetical protein